MYQTNDNCNKVSIVHIFDGNRIYIITKEYGVINYFVIAMKLVNLINLLYFAHIYYFDRSLFSLHVI